MNNMLRHALTAEIFGHLWLHFRHRGERVLPAPVEVQISRGHTLTFDLIVCDHGQVTLNGVVGAPDLVVEILLAGAARPNPELLARAGVCEYWLVTPYPLLIEVLTNRGGVFECTGAYSRDHQLFSPRFPELALDLGQINVALPFAEQQQQPTQDWAPASART